jgi:hypothetical protein
LNYSELREKLDEEEVLGIGGTDIDAYLLKNVTLTFPESEPPNHTESVDVIWTVRPPTSERARKISKAPSLL